MYECHVQFSNSLMMPKMSTIPHVFLPLAKRNKVLHILSRMKKSSCGCICRTFSLHEGHLALFTKTRGHPYLKNNIIHTPTRVLTHKHTHTYTHRQLVIALENCCKNGPNLLTCINSRWRLKQHQWNALELEWDSIYYA